MAAAAESPLHELFDELNAELSKDSDLRSVKNLLRSTQLKGEDHAKYLTVLQVLMFLEKKGTVTMKRMDLLCDLFYHMRREDLKAKVLKFAEKYDIPVREKHKRKRPKSPFLKDDDDEEKNKPAKKVYVGEPLQLRLVCETEIWSMEKKRQFMELEHKKIEMLMKAAERIYMIDLTEITKIEKGGHTKLQLMGDAFESFRDTLEEINVHDSPKTRRWYLYGADNRKVPLASGDVERLLTNLRVNDTVQTSQSDDGMALCISATVNSTYLEPLERSSNGLLTLPWNQIKDKSDEKTE